MLIAACICNYQKLVKMGKRITWLIRAMAHNPHKQKETNYSCNSLDESQRHYAE